MGTKLASWHRGPISHVQSCAITSTGESPPTSSPRASVSIHPSRGRGPVWLSHQVTTQVRAFRAKTPVLTGALPAGQTSVREQVLSCGHAEASLSLCGASVDKRRPCLPAGRGSAPGPTSGSLRGAWEAALSRVRLPSDPTQGSEQREGPPTLGVWGVGPEGSAFSPGVSLTSRPPHPEECHCCFRRLGSDALLAPGGRWCSRRRFDLRLRCLSRGQRWEVVGF